MQLILFFDGVCNLCNKSVQWIIKHDQKNQFLFAPLQGETAKTKAEHDLSALDSVVLLEGDTLYTESTAALRICKHIGGAWRLLYVLIIVPKPLRDRAYRFIAKRRYRWFGKQEMCMLPTAELKERFLD